IVRIRIALDVIEDDEAAAEDVLLERLHLGVGEIPAAGFRQIGDRVLEDLRVIDSQQLGAEYGPTLDERTHRRDLLHDPHEVDVGARVVVRPARALASAFVRALVLDSGEGDASVVWRIAGKKRRDEVVVGVPVGPAGAIPEAAPETLRAGRRGSHTERKESESQSPHAQILRDLTLFAGRDIVTAAVIHAQPLRLHPSWSP